MILKNENGKKDTSAWHQMMIIAFLTNGIGVFGTRILTGWDFAEQYKFQYLVFWYGSGFFLAVLIHLRNTLSFSLRELAIAGFMGAASVGGQLSLLTALEMGIPGHIVFPLANGGGLFLVALVGILLFGERVHSYGIFGIVLGIVATILLSLH
jgi:multidrug transporter EmrE-like cation transporter